MSSLAIIKRNRKPGEPGQSDVGGLYAYVMMQAFEITREARFLSEAKAALRAVRTYRFELLYQSNLTSWGFAACGWVWDVTRESKYLEQSYIFIANLFHNSAMWESKIGFAQSYSTFSGVARLHDGPYMAPYECYETFTALSEYMSRVYEAIPDSIRLLVSEHIKYGPNRAWFFYPGHLPAGALSSEVRNGHLDRRLSIPLEDLYVDGRPAGTVGQEVYGCGAAFAFAAHLYFRLKTAPFLLYCEYPLSEIAEADGNISFRILGAQAMHCRARLIPLRGVDVSRWTLRGADAQETEDGHLEFRSRCGHISLQLFKSKN